MGQAMALAGVGAALGYLQSQQEQDFYRDNIEEQKKMNAEDLARQKNITAAQTQFQTLTGIKPQGIQERGVTFGQRPMGAFEGVLKGAAGGVYGSALLNQPEKTLKLSNPRDVANFYDTRSLS